MTAGVNAESTKMHAHFKSITSLNHERCPLENYMQNSAQKRERLWGKVTKAISDMQATQTSWKNFQSLIGEVRANFNTYKTACIKYLDYLLNVNATECKEECEKYENIMDCHERFVETALSEANEHNKELMSEQQSLRSSS
jgi:conjugal transfer/entry exclusion protein